MHLAMEIGKKFELLAPALNERSRRLWAATEASMRGYGGIALVARATGMSRSTIIRGVAELRKSKHRPLPVEWVRNAGGGRKSATQKDCTLQADLAQLVAPYTAGDPENPLLWTTRSVRHLAAELQQHGHAFSYRSVARLLRESGYSLQGNRKNREGRDHPDRDAQFRFISARVKRQLLTGQPAISVDAKKKELVGPFQNRGREWRPKGCPEEVKVHDFLIKELGKALPYGVYDLAENKGWVVVGIDHDTAAFAAHTIRRWWRKMGQRTYPQARSLLITADSGGSNGPRLRLWKWELQKLANQTGLTIYVCHFPPGTSKWNKIEHRLFAFISKNWRARPLVSYQVILNLIASTQTTTGLTVECELDTGHYPLKRVVTPAEWEQVHITPETFHGEWNYTIKPRH